MEAGVTFQNSQTRPRKDSGFFLRLPSQCCFHYPRLSVLCLPYLVVPKAMGSTAAEPSMFPLPLLLPKFSHPAHPGSLVQRLPRGTGGRPPFPEAWGGLCA